jgi:hypothetical protein
MANAWGGDQIHHKFAQFPKIPKLSHSFPRFPNTFEKNLFGLGGVWPRFFRVGSGLAAGVQNFQFLFLPDLR